MNKKLLLLASVTIIALLPACAQVKKIYAYKQASIPGIQPKLITLEGGESQQLPARKETYNYWFYTGVSKNEKIDVTSLWISGKKYNVKNEPVNNLPVIKVNYTAASVNDTVIMVPVTRNAVMLTYPSGEANDSVYLSKYLSSLVNKYELVIAYKWKGKKYYTFKKTIIALAPEAHQ
jgi:hypothetical protein